MFQIHFIEIYWVGCLQCTSLIYYLEFCFETFIFNLSFWVSPNQFSTCTEVTCKKISDDKKLTNQNYVNAYDSFICFIVIYYWDLP